MKTHIQLNFPFISKLLAPVTNKRKWTSERDIIATPYMYINYSSNRGELYYGYDVSHLHMYLRGNSHNNNREGIGIQYTFKTKGTKTEFINFYCNKIERLKRLFK